MKKHLEKLKAKPDHQKHSIAQTMAIIVTVIVVIIWLTILTLQPKPVEKESTSENGVQNQEEQNSVMDSLDNLFFNAQTQFSNLQESYIEQDFFPEELETNNQELSAQDETTVSSESTDVDINSQTEIYGTRETTTE